MSTNKKETRDRRNNSKVRKERKTINYSNFFLILGIPLYRLRRFLASGMVDSSLRRNRRAPTREEYVNPENYHLSIEVKSRPLRLTIERTISRIFPIEFCVINCNHSDVVKRNSMLEVAVIFPVTPNLNKLIIRNFSWQFK